VIRIALAQSEGEIARCFPAMSPLRPHLSEGDFVGQVGHQQRNGYRLAYLEHDGEIRSLAGFRIMDMLAFGKMMNVDDLVTVEGHRSRAYGARLFDWLVAHASAQGCAQRHLDSGLHRFAAHRFYLMKRMEISSHHFSLKLDSPT
jgi:GNAT superfamily N-acetyltransferase